MKSCHLQSNNIRRNSILMTDCSSEEEVFQRTISRRRRTKELEEVHMVLDGKLYRQVTL